MLKTKSVTEQVAAHLREGLQQGRWKGLMPGHSRLAAEFDVNARTIARAMSLLEKEGLLKSQGPGRRRRILAVSTKTRQLAVGMVLYNSDDRDRSYVLELKNRVQSKGYDFHYAPKTLTELKHDPQRVKQMMEAHPAKVWIIQAGSRPLLEALSKSSTPTLALFGMMWELPIAGVGVDMTQAIREIMQRLFALGHHRIVTLSRQERRKAKRDRVRKIFVEELRSQGISVGSYNEPDWEETPEGLHRCLKELFQVSPPTAILVQDWVLLPGIMNFLSHQRGPALRKVALIYLDYHSCFDWCTPVIPHIQWEPSAVIGRVVRWIDGVAKGKGSQRQDMIPVKFVGGEVLENL